MEKAFYVVFMESEFLPPPFVKYDTLELAEKEAQRIQFATGRTCWVLKPVLRIMQKDFDVTTYE